MTTTRSHESSVHDAANAAWDRRRKAAWIDYLQITQNTSRNAYEQIEQNAWQQLQRRLRRNDELRDALLGNKNFIAR